MNERPVTILVVDDKESDRKVLINEFSKTGYHCEEAKNTDEAMAILRNHDIDVVILDMDIPGRAAPDVLLEINNSFADRAVIVAAGEKNRSSAELCLKLGAYDILSKPFVNDVVFFTVKRALERRKLMKEVKEYRQHLDDKLLEQAGRIKASIINTIRALVFALEAKDEYTSGHSQRVADLSAVIARGLHLPQDSIDKVVLAALVHDIGKIGIRESILNKKGTLTQDEIVQIQKHPEIGERIMGPVADDEEILKYIRHHHECFDGSGYPDRLKGYQIPLGARILSVADVYEAMTSDRPYRKAMSDKAVCAELIRCRETQFDPEVVEAFLRCKN